MNLASLITTATRTIQQSIGAGTVRYQTTAGYVDVAAGLGASHHEVTDAQGLLTTWRPRDFLILTADLTINGQRVIPHRNHRIRLTLNGLTETYVVTHPDAQQPPWRYSDPLNTTFRIHTNRIEGP